MINNKKPRDTDMSQHQMPYQIFCSTSPVYEKLEGF